MEQYQYYCSVDVLDQATRKNIFKTNKKKQLYKDCETNRIK